MSIQSEIVRITTEVSAQTGLIEQIQNVLGGGGTTAYSTCTVVFNGACKLYNIAYIAVSGGKLVAKQVYAAGVTNYTLNNVSCQSVLVVGINANGGATVSGGVTDMGILFSTSHTFGIDTTAGSTVTITIASA